MHGIWSRRFHMEAKAPLIRCLITSNQVLWCPWTTTLSKPLWFVYWQRDRPFQALWIFLLQQWQFQPQSRRRSSANIMIRLKERYKGNMYDCKLILRPLREKRTTVRVHRIQNLHPHFFQDTSTGSLFTRAFASCLWTRSKRLKRK